MSALFFMIFMRRFTNPICRSDGSIVRSDNSVSYHINIWLLVLSLTPYLYPELFAYAQHDHSVTVSLDKSMMPEHVVNIGDTGSNMIVVLCFLLTNFNEVFFLIIPFGWKHIYWYAYVHLFDAL